MKRIEIETGKLKSLIKRFKTIMNKKYEWTNILNFTIKNNDCKIYGISDNMDILETYLDIYKNYDNSNLDIYLNIDKLEQFIKNASTMIISFVIDDEENLFLQTENIKLKLPEVNTNSFDTIFNKRIVLNKYKEDSSIEIDDNIFNKILKYHLNFVSNDENRPIFKGIHFKSENKKIEIVSCDAFKLHRNIFDTDKDVYFDFILHQNSFKILLKIVKLIPKKFKEPIIISKIIDDNNINTKTEYKIKVDDFIIYPNLIEGEFVKAEQIISYNFNFQLEVKVDSFLQTLKSFDKKDYIIIEPTDTILKISNFKNNKNNISVKSEMIIEFKDFIYKEGSLNKIAFNLDYLIKSILPYENLNYINLNFIGELSPLTIIEEENNIKIDTICLPVKYKSEK